MKRIACIALITGGVLLTLAVAAFSIFILSVIMAGIGLITILAK